MLAESWVNAISAAVVTLSLARAWCVTGRRARRSRAALSDAGLFVDGQLLPTHVRHNRQEIERGQACGCLYCEQVFRPDEIRRWVEAGTTAVCPRCGADAVVGSGAGFRLTPQLLHRAHRVRFEEWPVRRDQSRAS